MRGSRHRAFVAATVDLITTGVDVPCLQNVVYFRYIKSPILFHQMLGRGTRIDEATGKRHFTVYDYTNATRLIDAPLQGAAAPSRQNVDTPRQRDQQNLTAWMAWKYALTSGEQRIGLVGEDGKLKFLSLEDYGQAGSLLLALRTDVSDLDELRNALAPA